MDSVLRHAHIEHPEKEKTTNDPELDDYLRTAFSITSSVDGGSSTADAWKGYDLTKGMLTDFLGDWYRKILLQSDSIGHDQRGKEGIFFAQEFGTLPSILVGRGLILDNTLYHFRKNRHKQKHATDEQFTYRSPYLGYAFYPQSTEWRRSIIQRGVAMVLEAMEYSAARSKSRS